MRFHVLFCGLLFLVNAPQEKSPKPEPVLPSVAVKDGYYEVSGSAGGKEYDGLVVIRKVSEAAYIVSWAGTDSVGVGTLDGERLVVGFTMPSGARGVAVFQAGKDVLEGYWLTLPGDGKRNPEKLTFLRSLKKQ